MTSTDAKKLMLDWAEGRLSHWNEYATYRHDPQLLLLITAECARADAAEVQKWAAVFQALLAYERGGAE
jgi:hypothetical protein